MIHPQLGDGGKPIRCVARGSFGKRVQATQPLNVMAGVKGKLQAQKQANPVLARKAPPAASRTTVEKASSKRLSWQRGR